MFGLIGYPLSHSFSKKYFTERFAKTNSPYTYELFELQDIKEFPHLLKKYPNLKGLNVTIPYKQSVMPYLDEISESAQRIGAVNVIKIHPDGRKVGYNTDYFGFKETIVEILPYRFRGRALIMGTGGAAQAVRVALEDLKIKYDFATRRKTRKKTPYTVISYNDVRIEEYRLLINATPLGMFPNIEAFPQIDYSKIKRGYYLYDLVYNPELTVFLREGKAQKAKTMNGLGMLHTQAEAAAMIWGV